ncbi:MAG TPA: hypothetical protein VFV58_39195 [Blastocatellia bacterium]|jgi:hypothetical protein|nr:hypothetical protein [Blastocatellia bacterium]
MPILTILLLVAALLCFLAGTVQVQAPTARPINWQSAGLALLTIVFLITNVRT